MLCYMLPQAHERESVTGRSLMPAVKLVTEEAFPSVAVKSAPSPGRMWGYLGVSALLLVTIGTWLVWFSVFIERTLQEEDIRAACRRAMPETAERCFDTVVIQRGGVRR